MHVLSALHHRAQEDQDITWLPIHTDASRVVVALARVLADADVESFIERFLSDFPPLFAFDM